jgi:multisubunit Na+/H+ antiporter MnhB subunit
MTEAGTLFDAILCLGLIGLALNAVLARNQFRATIMFMVFGLLMAACWARLQAPDLALAEAAIGAGLTGALLLNACKAAYANPERRMVLDHDGRTSLWLRTIAAAFCTLLGIGLAWLMLSLPGRGGPVPATVAAIQPDHFLDNPVTSVLLDYRAYDTLLEMVVLLLAIIGARILTHQMSLPTLYPPKDQDPPMVAPLLRAVTPLMLLTGLYLFWAGSHSPGGAFQAGALIAALGVMYRLTGRVQAEDNTSAVLRLLLLLGLGLFSLFAMAALWWADAPLSYPEQLRYPLVLLIEFALTLSIATTLILMFSASPGLRLERR